MLLQWRIYVTSYFSLLNIAFSLYLKYKSKLNCSRCLDRWIVLGAHNNYLCIQIWNIICIIDYLDIVLSQQNHNIWCCIYLYRNLCYIAVFVDLLCFCSVLCLLCLCARLFICALWSPAGKGLTFWLSFVVSTVSLSLSHWYPGSGVVLECIDSWSLHPYLLWA